jgi:hypothetical protein
VQLFTGNTLAMFLAPCAIGGFPHPALRRNAEGPPPGCGRQAGLVLDDYHLVDSPDLQPGVTYLLEHLPPQIHLVSTRADPALPLARLRACCELVEIRAADLRFTLAEAARSATPTPAGLERQARRLLRDGSRWLTDADPSRRPRPQSNNR